MRKKLICISAVWLAVVTASSNAEASQKLSLPEGLLRGRTAEPSGIQTSYPHEAAVGVASWYSERDPYINLYTANGEIFDDSQLTCASWDYPFGTRLRVTNLANGRSVTCRVNDRGPARRLNRMIDLTVSAFEQLAPPKLGLIHVQVVPVRRGDN